MSKVKYYHSNVSITREQNKILCKIAEMKKQSRAAVIREALDDYISKCQIEFVIGIGEDESIKH